MEKIVSGHDKAPGIAACTVLCALMNTLRDEGLLTPDDLRRLIEGARGDLAGVDRSEYWDARDIINHLARDVMPK